MISFEEAYKISTEETFGLGPEEVNLNDALGRVLATDIVADLDMPPFDKSAVDGFACKREDLSRVLDLIDTIPAGTTSLKEVVSGTCMKIMTGAPIPKGADCVVMVENSLVDGDKVHFDIGRTSANICLKGEDIRTGQTLITAGSLVKPGHIAVLATVGYHKVMVYKLPRVAILSTGDELVEPEEKPSGSSIRNSNAYQLLAQCHQLGIPAQYIGIAKDNRSHTREMIDAAMKISEVILMTGGVSMGDFDHVPMVMKEAGFEILFRKIAIQPGRPTVFAKAKDKLCFGLPGNPVSSFVLFEFLVKPVLFKMMGHTYRPVQLQMKLGVDYKRSRDDRMNIVPVRFQGDEVVPVDYHGSAHINAMTEANGFMVVGIGIKEFTKGSLVNVRPI